MSALCGCLRASPTRDTAQPRGLKRKDIRKDRNSMDLLALQKQMAMDIDPTTIAGLSFEEISIGSMIAVVPYKERSY